jgi:hypothetical protein
MIASRWRFYTTACDDDTSSRRVARGPGHRYPCIQFIGKPKMFFQRENPPGSAETDRPDKSTRDGTPGIFGRGIHPPIDRSTDTEGPGLSRYTQPVSFVSDRLCAFMPAEKGTQPVLGIRRSMSGQSGSACVWVWGAVKGRVIGVGVSVWVQTPDLGIVPAAYTANRVQKPSSLQGSPRTIKELTGVTRAA